MLEDVGLGAGGADVRLGGVGSGFQHEVHAELFAGGLHDSDAAAHGLIAHVTREGDVHEGVAAQLVSGADHQIAAGDKVIIAHQVGRRADLGQVFVGFAGNAEDVRAHFLDLAEGFGGAGHGLVDDDGLHQRVIGKVHDGLDGGFDFFGEVVGINGQLHHVFPVHRLEGLRAAAVILGLGNGTGDDADMELFLSGSKSRQRKHHRGAQQQRNKFLHVRCASLINCLGKHVFMNTNTPFPVSSEL